jgi:hypothetical protein
MLSAVVSSLLLCTNKWASRERDDVLRLWLDSRSAAVRSLKNTIIDLTSWISFRIVSEESFFNKYSPIFATSELVKFKLRRQKYTKLDFALLSKKDIAEI